MSASAYEAKGWSATSKGYEDNVGQATRVATAKLAATLAKVKPFDASSYVVDIGAGTGSFAVGINQVSPDAKILATDISRGMLDQIDARGIRAIKTQVEDARTLAGLGDDTFTHAVSSMAIQFTGDSQGCVDSMFRVVKPGGMVGLAIWGPKLDPFECHDKACLSLNPDYKKKSFQTPDAWRDEASHKRALEQAGFVDVGTEMLWVPLWHDRAQPICDIWFRSQNPGAVAMIKNWEAQGGDVEELEEAFLKVGKEQYDDGKAMGVDCLLGWGRKP